ncbi:MAG: carboxynorspermidine decarboxylase [Leptospiraceae bacterium]|nr:carboxynorspermidine decarboxylase [Leptospiraceae bacterium]MCK6380839.1 carboxynorspermidine decarboxylase [Leptospiraceae bacterium]NUM42921.1 carboxynorspermidine decarboxylase [Leptospiraceae bacterium]
MKIETPYYLIDEAKLVKNLEKIALLKTRTDAKSVLALKCFSTWSVFDLMKKYMDGTTSSSLYEAKLGKEKFGKEVHAYSVAWSEEEILEVKNFSTKIIFNSYSQLQRFYPIVKNSNLGIRINPRISHSNFDLANPARKYSRLGVTNSEEIQKSIGIIRGVMFHCNCDNDDFESFCNILDTISKNYYDILQKLEWVSLGGGIYFTKENYPFDKFCDRIKKFSDEFQVQVYFEPGEASITMSGQLVTSILDIVHNEKEIAIVDSSVEAHALDLLIYNLSAKIENEKGSYEYIIAGRTCLAGDVFGTYSFSKKLRVGDTITFSDMAGYTMVKKNWFNGVKMPSIVVKRLDGKLEVIRSFCYEDFLNCLS